MECPRCHAELDGRSRFCAACGYNVEDIIFEAQLAAEAEEEQLAATDIDSSSYVDVESEPESMSDGELEQNEDLEYETSMQDEDMMPEADKTPETNESVSDDMPGSSDEPAPIEQISSEWAVDFAELDEPFEAPLDEPLPADQVVYADAYPTEQDMGCVEMSPMSEGVEGIAPENDQPFLNSDYPERNIETDDTAQFAAIASEDASEAYTMASAYERGSIRSVLKRWRTLLVCLLCIIALVIAGISSVEWNRMQDKQNKDAAASLEADAHTPVQVGLSLDLDGYDEAHMTPVPLHVIGSATTGESVDELVLLQHPATDVLSLLKGSYIVSSGGPVLSDEGDLFEGTVDSFALSIQDDGITVNGRKVDAPDGKVLHFIYSRVEPQNVTDSELDAARTWMLKAEIVNYQAYLNAVTQKRQEAVDRLAAEQAAKEEADRQAAEEAARQAEEIKKREEEEKKKKEQEKEKSETKDSTTSETKDDTTSDNSSKNNTTSGSTTDGSAYGDDSYGSGYDSYGYDSYGYDSGYGYNDYGYSDDYYGV